MIRQLEQDGYTVIECIAPSTHKVVTTAFVKAVYSGPELQTTPGNTIRRLARGDVAIKNTVVGGGFCASGNPSSFHDKRIRTLRTYAHYHTMDHIFGPLLRENPHLSYRAIIDRVMVRPANKSPTVEGVHRDCPPGGEEETHVHSTYGGWLALSDTVFWCCPGTHTEDSGALSGFAKIKDPKPYNEALTKVCVPKGSILVFNERLVHAVKPTKGSVSIRLFLGHQLCYGNHPIDPSLHTRLKTQAPIPLKSGQESRMWPKLWWVNHRDKIAKLGRILSPQARLGGAITRQTVQSGKHKGDVVTGVTAVMPSLKAMGLPLHAEYSKSELELYSATRGPWRVQVDNVTIFEYIL